MSRWGCYVEIQRSVLAVRWQPVRGWRETLGLDDCGVFTLTDTIGEFHEAGLTIKVNVGDWIVDAGGRKFVMTDEAFKNRYQEA
jgi:hypothetical protein